MCILVVEGNRADLKLVAAVVEFEGYTVRKATDAQQALGKP